MARTIASMIRAQIRADERVLDILRDAKEGLTRAEIRRKSQFRYDVLDRSLVRLLLNGEIKRAGMRPGENKRASTVYKAAS